MIPSAMIGQLQRGLADFLRYSFWSSTPGMEKVIDDLLNVPGGVTRGPYLSVKLPFLSGGDPNFFPQVPLGFPPHAHQEAAFERLGGEDKKNTLVATGTGSGKTECFLLPILQHCLENTSTPGVKAILVYPMNALATDQAGRLAGMIHDNPNLKGKVTAGLYIGESKGSKRTTDERMGPRNIITDRKVMQSNPPDILLTNYKMLDYLLLRPWDQKIWQHNHQGVFRFLVVDELHTFDGAQGTDLACLIRRLKRRLRTDDGSLCCVGTSATLGGEGSRKHLASYAQQVFGEPFDEESLIGESCVDARGFLSGAQLKFFDEPGFEDMDTLSSEGVEDPHEWVRAQVKLWFGKIHEAENENTWAVELGNRLLRHATFRTLLKIIDRKVTGLDETVQYLSRERTEWRENPQLGRASVLSLLGLISAARSLRHELSSQREQREKDGQARPIQRFLDVRLQIWQREMRRMVASVTAPPQLRFSDDLDRQQRKRHLPLVHCRDCGAIGWATLIDRDKPHLVRTDLSSFYRGFFRADPRIRFLYPKEAVPKGDPSWEDQPEYKVDSDTLVALGPDDDSEGGTVDLVASANTRSSERGQVLHKDCPFCSARESLALVGFRAATLTSVYIDQLFASRFNDERDKKLLAFSDSVQDAAHRAGFFGARTWRANLRVALRQLIQDKHEGSILADLPDQFSMYWKKKLDPATWVSTFIAPNMVWLHDWDVLQREGTLPSDSDLPGLITRRLAFEITTEFGHQATIGRSLPRTMAATVYVDDARFEEACNALVEPLRNKVPGLREVTSDQVRGFVMGLLHQLRVRGGIYHSEIPDRYLESGGSDIWVFKQWSHLPAFGKTSRLPAFLTDSPRSGRFDTWTSRMGGKPGWYERWVNRWFARKTDLNADADSTYTVALPVLVAKGLLRETEGKKGDRIWGVAEDALRVTANVVGLRCAHCHHQIQVAASEEKLWRDVFCLSGRCKGKYTETLEQSVDYFGRMYSHGDLQRIFTAEHTGLLTREERETIESQFKAESPKSGEGADQEGNRRPWYPNLLSCTPTLEMGIDIGDLSSAILCSVPPTQANYLQRIGRTGRRDGNSLVLSVANARPHDLYFYASPKEMMEGDVMPPGVYLDASAVLERQLTAFCFDRWVAREGEAAILPPQMREVFSHLEDEGSSHFPHNFLTFVGNEQPVILREFREMFAEAISETTQEHIKAYLQGTDDVAGLRWRVLNVFQKEKKQRNSLGRKARDLAGALRKLKDSEARPLDFDDRVTRLEEEKAAVQALVTQVDKRQILEFLTDEGMLPNYAFPESAVKLSSVIWRKKKRVPSSGSKYDTWTYEYSRSPGSALSEFAPMANFYAGGRRVRIDQVDVTVSEIETWRFCDSCSHASRIDLGDDAQACPACGSTTWMDDDQKLRLLPLRQVFANAPDRESRLRDDRDDRQPRFFQRQVLIDFTDEDRQGAWKVDEPTLPFGFEFLRKATFRELNFGEHSEHGNNLKIAGRDAVRPGFQICTRCGKVQQENQEPVHTLSCPTKTTGAAPSIEACLYLYREFSSEALRMLLPMADLGSRKQINSFVAALQVGLKARFGGSVDHLKTMVYSEPDPDSSLRRQYLVLFDSVPGGTGYLKQLVTARIEGAQLPLFEVLEMAVENLLKCSCWQDPDRDGCYKCLLAYRNAGDMDDTSAMEAVQIIKRILARQEKLKEVESLSQISVSGLMDSVLEVRFIEALKQGKYRGKAIRVRDAFVRNKPGYRVTIGDQEWTVEPQVGFDSSAGYGIGISIDFVLRPTGAEARKTDRKPIAVFLDGWEWHKDRIGRDLLQRAALLASGRWDVWTFTWYDLDEILDDRPSEAANVLHPDWEKLRTFIGSAGLKDFKDIAERPVFEVFRDELGKGTASNWEHIGNTLVASRMEQATSQHVKDWADILEKNAPADVREMLATDNVRLFCFDNCTLSPWVSLYAIHDGEQARVLAVLDDRPENLGAPEYRKTWNGFMRLFQFLRQLPSAWFVTTTPVDVPGFAPVIRLRSGPGEEPWGDLSDVDQKFEELCSALQQEGIGAPEIGVDIPNAKGGTWAEAELCWEDARIAVTDKGRADEAEGQIDSSWTVLVLEDLKSPGQIVELLNRNGGA